MMFRENTEEFYSGIEHYIDATGQPLKQLVSSQKEDVKESFVMPLSIQENIKEKK